MASPGHGDRQLAGREGAAVPDVSGTYRVTPDNSVSVIYQNGANLTIHNSRWGPPSGTLSGNVITAWLLLKLTGVFEDGVIRWNTGQVCTRTGPAPADPEEALREDTGWFPGKTLKKTIGEVRAMHQENKAAKSAGQYEDHHLSGLDLFRRLRKRRQLATRTTSDMTALGSVSVAVLGGEFSTSRPYFLLSLDGNEARTPVAKTHTPVWGEGALPKAESTLPLYDPSSDLCLFLCDDAGLKNEHAIGRVIVPIRDLCTQALLPQPLPAHTKRFSILPAARQGRTELQARYTEAVPHVPGSGMVRPVKDLGFVELRLQLELTAPGHQRLGLLAAYALARPPGPRDDDSEDESSSPSGSKKKPDPSPKIIHGNLIRLQRCFVTPNLLRRPAVFAQPLVLYFVCFKAKIHHLPWAAFALMLASGVLGRLNRDELTKDMIFWEESVGEDGLPHGLAKIRMLQDFFAKLQVILGKAADILEKLRNHANFADPPVTLVALLLHGIFAGSLSSLFYFVPLRKIFFAVGMTALAPFLYKAISTGGASHDRGAKALAAGVPMSSSASMRKGGPLRSSVQMLSNVLARIPDTPDIAHRHLCAMQVVDPQSPAPAGGPVVGAVRSAPAQTSGRFGR